MAGKLVIAAADLPHGGVVRGDVRIDVIVDKKRAIRFWFHTAFIEGVPSRAIRLKQRGPGPFAFKRRPRAIRLKQGSRAFRLHLAARRHVTTCLWNGRSLIRLCVHTAGGHLRLGKKDLDGPHKDRKCKSFDDGFFIEIFFETVQLDRQSQRIDAS